MTTCDAAELRGRLGRARLMLIYTPELVRGCEPLDVLDAVLGEIDVVQVRVKAEGRTSGPSPARALYDTTAAVLDLVAGRPALDPPVIVNDRVDVAAALAGRGVCGVHLGQDDLSPAEARTLLGEELLIGLSTHTARQVAEAQLEPVDYLGFGPVFATRTKGHTRGLGPEAAWVASAASTVPVFAIGGLSQEHASELVGTPRLAVASAILGADDPERAAHALRALLDSTAT